MKEELEFIQSQAHNRELQQAAVAQLGMHALSGSSVQDLLELTVSIIADTLDADYVKVLRYDPDKKELRMVAGHGWKPGLVRKVTVPDEKNSQAGFTLLTDEPVIVKNMEEEERFKGPELLTDHGVTSGISCKIGLSDPPYGVLGVHTKKERAFNREDANFLLSVANLLSITITDRLAWKRLNESEEQFRMLANSIPQLAWMADPQGYIYWYNQRWFDYTGTTLKEMEGWGWTKTHHPDHVDGVVEKFRNHINRVEEWEDTFPIRSATGEFRWFLSRARPILNEDGEVLHWFGTNTDITEQRETQRALKESEQKLRMAKDSNRLGAFEYYLQHEQTEWDPLLHDIWGLKPGEKATQEVFWEGIHPEDRECTRQAIGRAMDPENDGHYYSVYRVINRRTGQVTWLEGSGQVMFEDDQAVKMVGMVIDITDKKVLENTLQGAIRELQSANHKKNEFLATLGHELRNPLASISGGIQMLQMDQPDSEELRIMANGVNMMSSLLDDLLDLTRIERGKVKLKKDTLDLSEVLTSTVNSFSTVLHRKEHQLQINLPEQPVYISGDRTRLEQIFTNLLSNANKFTPANGTITVEMEERDGQAHIRMCDNGAGLAPGTEQVIFEPFEQVEDQTSYHKGLGIGLALVRQFVQLHEGTISARSEGLGQGTTFHLSFPLTNQCKVDIPETPLPEASDLHPLTILVVDDNEDALKGIRSLLERMEHTVATALSGNEALERVKELRPDVFILDIGLPDIDGYALIHKLRSVFPSATYIAHTGYGHAGARSLSRASGFHYHLNKPLKVDELISILREVPKRADKAVT